MVEIKSRHQYDIDKKKEEFEKLKREKSEELDTVHEKYFFIFLYFYIFKSYYFI